MRGLVTLLAVFFLSGAVSAAPWHYGLIDDLQKAGDIGEIKDLKEFSMSFAINYPHDLIAEAVVTTLENAGFTVEQGNDDGENLFVTDWYEIPEGEKILWQKFRVRKQYIISLTPLENESSRLEIAYVEQSQLYDDWELRIGSGLRNKVREIAAEMILFCRYSVSEDTRESVYNNYKKERVRVGKKDYQLPPSDNWVEGRPWFEEPPALGNPCPSCGENTLVTDLECSDCGKNLTEEGALAIISFVTSDPVLAKARKLLWRRLDFKYNRATQAIVIDIKGQKETLSFEVSAIELLKLASKFQEAEAAAKLLPPGKDTVSWTILRKNGAALQLISSAVLKGGTQQVVIVITGENEEPVGVFYVPVWWLSSSVFVGLNAEVSNQFDRALARALAVAKLVVKESSNANAPDDANESE